MRVFAAAMGTAAALALGACSSDPQLMSLDNPGPGPDEFAILPTKPLELPPDLNRLPAPNPGGPSITDPTPEADAVAALGGNPGQLSAQGIGAGDAALIAYASRAGRGADIRAVTAAEDAQFRAGRSRRLLEILARTNVYYRAYGPQTLDAHAELERWRRAGARTPAAPPPPLD